MGLFDISSTDGDSFFWSDKIPADKSEVRLPGAVANVVTGGWGDMIFQHKVINNLTIWYSNYFLKERRTFRVKIFQPIIEFSFLIHNDVMQGLKPLYNDQIVKSCQFNIMYVPHVEHTATFARSENYTTLDIHCTKEYLQSIQHHFPEIIEPFLNEVDAERPVQLFDTHMFATNTMLALAKEIIRLLKTSAPDLLVDQSAHLLLTYALACKRIMSANYRIISLQELSAINRISTMIVENLSNPPNIRNLAREAGMNTTTLRQLFKGAFKKTIYDHWSTYRMDAALDRILHTDESISSISIDIGFSGIANFSKAFKKRYSIPPTAYRKKN